MYAQLTAAGQDPLAVGSGLASAHQDTPVHLEFWNDSGQLTITNAGYASWAKAKGGWLGRAIVGGPDASRFEFEDRWLQVGDTLRLDRTVRVSGKAPGGFLSGFTFDFVKASSWTTAEWSVPEMIYGGFEGLTDSAIGGRAHYRPGNFAARVREDRVPAPLILAHFSDGTSLAMLDPAPRGDTTVADSQDTTAAVQMVDERFQFGAIGAEEREGKLAVGFWLPGTEGEVTYAGNTYPGGHLHRWRRRYHPIREGLVQRYQIAFRSGSNESYPTSYAAAWRWAWQTLKPALTRHDIETARECLVDVLIGRRLYGFRRG